MSLYSSKIKCDIIDPNVDIQNNRVEFKLPAGTGYYPTLRLANFGSTGGNVQMSHSAGALGLIRHIRLLNGAQELSSARFVNRWMAFKNFNNSNSDNLDINSNLYGSHQGYSYNNTLKISPHGGALNQAQTGDSIPVQATKSTSVNLMELLPLLKSIPVLDTNVFEDLRLQIEYDTDSANWLHDTTAASNTIQPYLIAEEIQDPKLVQALSKNFKGVVWNEIEHDVFNIPDNANGNDTELVQTINQQINGFDNKYVSRVVLCKAFSVKGQNKIDGAGNVVAGMGDFGSICQWKEKINFVLNGKTVLSGDGLDTSAKKSMMLNDVWGNCNMVSFGNSQSVGVDGYANSTNVVGVPVLNGNKQGVLVGQQDFVGISLESRVNQLEINYERKTPKNHAGNVVNTLANALDCHVYCEVRKQLQIQNGRYVLAYV